MSTSTYTLRLSDELKSRLERTAEYQGLSLNQLITEIISQHYERAGFYSSNSIQLKNGRQLRIRASKSDRHAPGLPSCWFHLDDSNRDCEIASYEIGASEQLLRLYSVKKEDEYEVVKELGKALLHFHNENGTDITRLEWRQLPTRKDYRLLNSNDLKDGQEELIPNLVAYHQALVSKQWIDRHLKNTIKPFLSKTMAMTLQAEAQKQYDRHISSLTDPVATEQLSKERDRMVKLLGELIPEGADLGAGDPSLNENEVHIFSERWKQDRPPLERGRVVMEIGKGNADLAISSFVYEFAHFYLETGQPYICRWIDKGTEKERALIAP